MKKIVLSMLILISTSCEIFSINKQNIARILGIEQEFHDTIIKGNNAAGELYTQLQKKTCFLAEELSKARNALSHEERVLYDKIRHKCPSASIQSPVDFFKQQAAKFSEPITTDQKKLRGTIKEITTPLNDMIKVLEELKKAEDDFLPMNEQTRLSIKYAEQKRVFQEQMLLSQGKEYSPEEKEALNNILGVNMTHVIIHVDNITNLEGSIKKLREKKAELDNLEKKIETQSKKDNKDNKDNNKDISWFERVTDSKLKRTGVAAGVATLIATASYVIAYINTPEKETSLEPGQTPTSRHARAWTTMKSYIKNPFVIVALAATTAATGYWISQV